MVETSTVADVDAAAGSGAAWAVAVEVVVTWEGGLEGGGGNGRDMCVGSAVAAMSVAGGTDLEG